MSKNDLDGNVFLFFLSGFIVAVGIISFLAQKLL
jgi:hypothetical protein